jgi:uncharacterized membrane protein
MNKSLFILSLVCLISTIGRVLGGIWVLVSFCLYLFKDIGFDYRSIWLFSISIVIEIISKIIFKVVKEIREEESELRSVAERNSKFQSALQEMAKKRGL